MATYVIGDLHGCYEALQQLLDTIRYDPVEDHLWFVGDLVNRGPQSLACLRFVRDLGERGRTVLGNHDIHLLAIAAGVRKPGRRDTLNEIIAAPDCAQLIDWLRHQPLLHRSDEYNTLMVHAGVHPGLALADVEALCRKTEKSLRSTRWNEKIEKLFGNEPSRWSPDLKKKDRRRFTINMCTRMRYLERNGALNLKLKGSPNSGEVRRARATPWFSREIRATQRVGQANYRVVFGHWSTLQSTGLERIIHLDHGCVWGGRLSALRLDDGARFSKPCQPHQSPT